MHSRMPIIRRHTKNVRFAEHSEELSHQLHRLGLLMVPFQPNWLKARTLAHKFTPYWPP